MKYFILSVFLLAFMVSCTPKTEWTMHQGWETEGYKIINGKKVVVNVKSPVLDTLPSRLMNRVINYLSELDGQFPEDKAFVLVDYYPGPDPCNTSGSGTLISNRGMKSYQKAIDKRQDLTRLGIFKNMNGLDEYEQDPDWFRDNTNLIESTFFQWHYPCNSFMVLHRSGVYFASYGEHSSEWLWQNVDGFRQMIKKRNKANNRIKEE